MEITPNTQTPAPMTHFGVANLFKVEEALNLARANSLWPLTFGLACCAMELIAGGAARFDLDRFGFGVARPSPRQADLMIVAGTISRKMVPCIKTLYDQMPAPKYVIALGGCATAGGPFKYPGQYGILEGIDKIIPVNVYIPGCPPRPEALFAGLIELQRLIKEGKTQGTMSPAVVKDSQDNRPAEYKNAMSRAEFRQPRAGPPPAEKPPVPPATASPIT